MASPQAVKAYDVADFIVDLRAIVAECADEMAIIRRVRPLVQRLARDPVWLKAEHRHCDPDQGFGCRLLHEEPDHSLAVLTVAWLPGRGVAPHNHGTWAVVAGVEGSEKNVFWRRVDDGSRPGYGEIVKDGEKLAGPGDVVAFRPDDIHSIVNESDAVTVSLHCYGRHTNHTDRWQFDPATNKADRLKIKFD
jgi:predicted metal-dependent enzyme (double-stranded beta helix superfamily)